MVRHIYSSQCFDKTPEVTCAGQKLERFRRHIIHKCTQMYLFVKEPVCDTVDSRLRHFKTLAAAKGLCKHGFTCLPILDVLNNQNHLFEFRYLINTLDLFFFRYRLYYILHKVLDITQTYININYKDNLFHISPSLILAESVSVNCLL